MTNVSVYLNILYINYIFRRLIFMNEGILIAYDDTYYSIGDTLVIQKRLTDILKPCGMRYFTGRSLYKPDDPDRRDDIMYDAMKLLSQCEWIDNKNVGIFVIDDIISISFSDIDCSGMVEPKSEKYMYYEDYFKKTGRMAHNILIDENNQIVDGYVSLLIADKHKDNMKKWQNPEIYKVNALVPHAKVVIGRHVDMSGTDIIIKEPQYFAWIYNKKEPVVPGDVLKVNTRKGEAYMVVEKIKYIAGKKKCAEYKKVIEHMGMRIEI